MLSCWCFSSHRIFTVPSLIHTLLIIRSSHLSLWSVLGICESPSTEFAISSIHYFPRHTTSVFGVTLFSFLNLLFVSLTASHLFRLRSPNNLSLCQSPPHYLYPLRGQPFCCRVLALGGWCDKLCDSTCCWWSSFCVGLDLLFAHFQNFQVVVVSPRIVSDSLVMTSITTKEAISKLPFILALPLRRCMRLIRSALFSFFLFRFLNSLEDDKWWCFFFHHVCLSAWNLACAIYHHILGICRWHVALNDRPNHE